MYSISHYHHSLMHDVLVFVPSIILLAFPADLASNPSPLPFPPGHMFAGGMRFGSDPLPSPLPLRQVFAEGYAEGAGLHGGDGQPALPPAGRPHLRAHDVPETPARAAAALPLRGGVRRPAAGRLRRRDRRSDEGLLRRVLLQTHRERRPLQGHAEG